MDLRKLNSTPAAVIVTLPRYELWPDDLKMPPFTCPLIGEIAARIRRATSLISSDPERAQDLLNDLVPTDQRWTAGETLEELRQHNDTLRTLAYHWQDVAYKLHGLGYPQPEPPQSDLGLAVEIQLGLDEEWEAWRTKHTRSIS